MKKRDIVETVAKKANLTNKAAGEAIDALLTAIKDALKKGDRVVLTGFGTFDVRERGERKGRNPKTGQSLIISARKAPGFAAGKALRKAVMK
jgi:DNA-binding protein HU-beta